MTPSAETWLNDGEQVVWRRLLSAQSRLHERLDMDLKHFHGLPIGDYAVLVHLSEADGAAMRMSDLAALLVISRSGLTRRVDAMERRGLVCRRPCPRDGRGSMAQLTPAGADLLRRAAPTHVAGVRRYLIDALGDLSGLDAGLRRVEAALDGAAPLPCPGPDRSARLTSGDDLAAPLDPSVGAAGH